MVGRGREDVDLGLKALSVAGDNHYSLALPDAKNSSDTNCCPDYKTLKLLALPE